MRQIRKELAVILAGIFLLTDSLCLAQDAALAPRLRAASPDFKKTYETVTACRSIEDSGSIAGRSEVVIPVPDEGTAIRYFDPRRAPYTTPFNNISGLSTKKINDGLHRQIISTGGLRVAASGSMMTWPATTVSPDLILMWKQLAEKANSSPEGFNEVVANLKAAAREYPIFGHNKFQQTLGNSSPDVRNIMERALREAARSEPDMKRVRALILAGGPGLRLWPKSTARRPKYLATGLLPSGKNSFQDTILRLTQKEFLTPDQIYILTLESTKEEVKTQAKELDVPLDHIIIEPMFGGTTAAIAFMAKYFERKDPNTTMLVLMSDIYIKETEKFQSSAAKAIEMAQAGPYLVSIGVRPYAPSTHFGYIALAGETAKPGVHKVSDFIEKPSEQLARKFFEEKDKFLWEGGMLVWNIETVFKALHDIIPEYDEYMLTFEKCLTGELEYTELIRVYAKLKSRLGSGLRKMIDHAIFEPVAGGASPRVSFAAVPADITWADIGSSLWGSPRQVNKDKIDKKGNLILGPAEDVDHKDLSNCSILPEPGRKIAARGLANVVVADSNNSTLSASSADAKRSGDIADSLKMVGLGRYVDGDADEASADSRTFMGSGCLVYSNSGLAVTFGLKDTTLIRSGKGVYIYGPDYKDDGRTRLDALLDEDFRRSDLSIDITFDMGNDNFYYSVSKDKPYRFRFTGRDGVLYQTEYPETYYVFTKPAKGCQVTAHKNTQGKGVETLSKEEIMHIIRELGIGGKYDPEIPGYGRIMDLLTDSVETLEENSKWKVRFRAETKEEIWNQTSAEGRFPRKKLEVMSRWVEDGQRILDVGFGSGRMAIAIARANPKSKVIGIDLRQDAVNLAVKGAEMRGVKNVEFQRANALDLKEYFPKGSFDVVYSDGLWQNLTLEECDVLAEILVYLVKPGGNMIVASPNADAPSYRLWRRVAGEEGIKRRYGMERNVTRGELTGVLAKHGVNILDIEGADPLYCLGKLYRIDSKTGEYVPSFWASIARIVSRTLDHALIDPVDWLSRGALSRKIGTDILVRGIVPVRTEAANSGTERDSASGSERPRRPALDSDARRRNGAKIMIDRLSDAALPEFIFPQAGKGVSASVHPVSEFVERNKRFPPRLFVDGKIDILLRVPVEALESIGEENLKDFFGIFEKNPNIYVELYTASGIGEIDERLYRKYGLARPKNFKMTRENTVTLLPVSNDEKIDQAAIAARLGTMDITPTDTILSPIGLKSDSTGLIRSSILGLKIMEVARQIKEKRVDKDRILLDILEQFKDLCSASGIKDFNLTPDDIISLANGNINNVIAALKKLIKLLPLAPIDAEELRRIYDHAKSTLSFA